MGNGRPSKLTPETSEAFLKAFRETGTLRAAALSIGVHPATVMTWLAKGRKAKNGPYRDFHEALSRAMGDHLAGLERSHHRLALLGQVIRKPKRREITDDKGRVTFTTEILRRCQNCGSAELEGCGNHKLEIEWEEHWEEVSPEAKLRAQGWELRFRDRETYAEESAVQLKGEVAINQAELEHSVDLIGQAFRLMLSLGVPVPAPVAAHKAIETTATPVEAGE